MSSYRITSTNSHFQDSGNKLPSIKEWKNVVKELKTMTLKGAKSPMGSKHGKSESPMSSTSNNEHRILAKNKTTPGLKHENTYEIENQEKPSSRGPFSEGLSPIVPKSCLENIISEPESKSALTMNLTSDDLTKNDWTGRHLFRENAFRRLLTLLDIPMLDGILQVNDEYSEQEVPGQPASTLVQRIGLQCGRFRFSTGNSTSTSRCKAFIFNDQWMESAAKILEDSGHKLLMDVAAKYMNDDISRARRLIYIRVKEFYKQLAGRGAYLLPHAYEIILQSIAKLLFTMKPGSTDDAIEATQLMMTLLNTSQRNRLVSVIEFLDIVSQSEKEQLSNKCDNITQVINDFTPFLVKTRSDSERFNRFWLRFAINNSRIICSAVGSSVWDKFYEHPIARPQVNYSHLMTPDQFEKQGTQFSETALTHLVSSVMCSNLSHEEKVKWLAKFKTEYPVLYKSKFFFLDEKI